MTQVKKAFQPIVDLLENAVNENSKAKISDVLAQVIELTSAKAASREGSTFIKNAAGETVAIHDYYFKRWMPVVGSKAVEFGKKEKTGSGYNTMSKVGQNLWNKQLRDFKNAERGLLDEIAKGNVQPSEIADKQAEFKAAREKIEDTDLGFATKQEVLDYLASEGVDIDQASASEASE